MAAAALLRSVARKLAARAPPPHPLARGLHDGARTCPGSLPPPPPPKIAGSPLQGYHRLLHERGLHGSTSPTVAGASGSTTPPISDKDLIENLRIRLRFAKLLASVAGTVAVHLYFWVLPEAEAKAKAQVYSNWDDNLTHAIKKLESILVEEDAQSSGHGGTRVDKSEADQLLKAFPVTKEIADGIKDIQANVNATETSIKDRQAAAAVAELISALEAALHEGERKE